MDDLQIEAPRRYLETLEKQGFLLQHRIGGGLSGSVYKAWQPKLDRPVAVKFFDNPFSKKDDKLKVRFIKEGILLAKCQHPRIPYVITTGVVPADDVPYIVLEFVEGSTLRAILEKAGGPLGVKEALTITGQVLEALARAHSQGVLHRDVKPENIFCSDVGCTLIDFSIGVELGNDPIEERVTSTGERVGTPQYSAPELLDDASRVGPAADVFSVGLCLFEMLTGFVDRRAVAMGQKQLGEFLPELREIVVRSTNTSLADRYENATEMLRALRPLLANQRPLLVATTVVCVGAGCWQYDNWDGGTYWPRFEEDVEDAFCAKCGSELIRGCPGCGAPITKHSEFCGKCGACYWDLGECERCFTKLVPADLWRNIASDGCSACQTFVSRYDNQDSAFNDDDIPF